MSEAEDKHHNDKKFIVVFIKVDYVCHGKVWDCPDDPYAVPKEKNMYRVVDSGSDLTTEMIIERIVSHA